MHRTGRQDHRHGHPARALMLIGQDQLTRARRHRHLSLRPDALQPLPQRISARACREGAIDEGHLIAKALDQNLILAIADERAFQHQNLGLAVVLVQDVAQIAEPGFQRHHPAFAQGVDRRVGHLAEILPEEMRQRAVNRRQDSRRRIIAHRGDHFLAVLHHRGQNLLQLFNRIARRDLPLAQLGPGELRLLRHVLQQRVQINDLANPIAIGLGIGQLVLQLGVMEELALGHIDSNHLPRPQGALFANGGFIHRHHPCLRARNQQPIAGHDIAHRAQAIAIKAPADPAAVGHRQRRRTIPRLDDRVAVGIHIRPSLGHVGRGLGPRLRHQHGFRHGGRPARADQDLEHRIQSPRIRGATRNDRLDILSHIPKGGRSHADLVALHPVDVALQRVDLAVMGEHPEGLGQPPLREGVGAVTLVIDRKGGLEPLIHQIGVEGGDLFGQHHALVDDAAAGQGAQIHPLNPGGIGGFLNPAADDVQLPLKLLLIDVLFTADQDLLNLGPRRIGLVAQNARVHRHMPPAINVMAHAQHFGFHDGPATLLRAKVGARQEHLPDRDQLFRVRLMARAAHLVIEELDRNLHMDPRPVASLAIGIDRAPVPHRLQRVDPVFHDLTAGLAGNRHHKTHAAGRMLILGLVKPIGIQPSALGLFGLYPGVIIGCHGSGPFC